MESKLLRFKYCDPRFFPYIEKVLNRLPEEIKEDILNNINLQILGYEGFLVSLGMHFKFDKPVINVVYLNIKILKEPESTIIYTIAHELAHYVVGKGETGLHEKEAEETLLEWGFDIESEKYDYDRPKLESLGQELGYKWALKQNDQDLIDKCGPHFDDWNNDRLSDEQIEILHYELDPTSIMVEMGQLESGIEKDGESAKTMYSDDGSGDKGVIWGVMRRLKEIFANRKPHFTGIEAVKIDFFNTLEEINMKFDKLSTLFYSPKIIAELNHYGILECAVNVAEFLEEYKKS